MVADVPFVSYKDKKKGKKPTKSNMDSLADAWAKKHSKEGKKEKISLSDYLKQDINSVIS